MASEAGLSEEKAQRAMIDAARLADELRGEQEMAQNLERERKLLEAQAKDMQARLDDAEQNALKGGKKAMGKMDTRIRELESEIDAENRRLGDAQKGLRKSERKIKELTYQQDEDRKNHERMQALIDQLQGKIKSYKKQIEEAEEIAALNLAKFRQVQSNLSSSMEAADLSEQALAKLKTRARSSSVAPVSWSFLRALSNKNTLLLKGTDHPFIEFNHKNLTNHPFYFANVKFLIVSVLIIIFYQYHFCHQLSLSLLNNYL